METQKINGIVVSVSKYKDYDALCLVLTENGTRRVKFTGVRKPNAKMAFAAQPFCCGEFLLSSANDYATVIQVNQTNNFYSIASNYDAFILGSKMLKVAQKIATNDSKDLLNTLLLCLSTMQIEGIDLLVIENYFQTKILQILGIWGSFNCCTSCGKELKSGAILNTESGALFCKDCASNGGVVLSKNLYEYLYMCANNTLSELIANPVADGVNKKANEILSKTLENQI